MTLRSYSTVLAHIMLKKYAKVRNREVTTKCSTDYHSKRLCI